MELTLKILINITLGYYFVRAWTAAIGVATVDVLAKQAPTVSRASRDKLADATGKATVAALGATLWMVPLAVLIWLFL